MNYQDSRRHSPVETFESRRSKHGGGFLQWWKTRLSLTAAWDQGLGGVIFAMYLASMFAAVIGALATPTGLGMWIDLLIFTGANTALFLIVSFGFAFVLSLLYVPLPRIILSASVYTAYLAYYIQEEANLGILFTTVMTGVLIISAYVLGGLFHIWLSRMPSGKKALYSLIPVIWFIFIIFFHPTIEHHDTESTFTGETSTSLDAANPGDPGVHEVEHIFYGNGQDRHRDHFAEDTDLVSDSVDASLYFDDNEWEGWRTRFWGFDETALPLNGEMWLPDAEGPFPVVLIAHGNHRMENFSDGGYGYLGEHLASHGYAAVSIDQNFVNFSNWTGIPDEDMKLRAWLFMQHLLQLEQFNETDGNLLASRLDMDQLALIGHSRGGQAAAMAADYEQFFETDPSLAGIENLDITSVVGLAPTDQQVDDMRAAPVNINYLSLHGARDGDVHNFRGDRQYARTGFDDNSGFMKSAVYIAEANHSQFNTDWGRSDMRLPGGMFLSREQMMEPEEQRELTNVFLTAFLEATLRGEDQYVPLFEDVNYGSEWLPDTQYVTRYLDSSYNALVTFNRSNERELFPEGVEAEGTGFEEWDKVSTEDRNGDRKAPDGVVVEWEDEGSYSLTLPADYRDNYFADNKETFSFSMAQMDKELEGDLEGKTDPALDIRFTYEDGSESVLALEEYDEIPSSIWTQFTRYPFLEDHFREGKYEEAVQPAFQTHMLPVELFTEDADLNQLEQITFEFSEGPGRLIIDNIGFFSE